MPTEIKLWALDGDSAVPVETSTLASEQRLEAILENDLTILGLGSLLCVGRQVVTPHGGRVDLLALDNQGALYVIELKRDKTPRDVVAQALDYASWASGLDAEAIGDIWQAKNVAPLAEALSERFSGDEPEEINTSHQVVIVASALDDSSERIVEYLSGFGVPVNAVFFRYFEREGQELLARTWLVAPDEAQARGHNAKKVSPPWNGKDMYVSFGEGTDRNWEDAETYSFVCGGGGPWHSRTLTLLQPGLRVWVNIPGRGYVGVGIVEEPSVPVEDFRVNVDGREVPILDAPLKASTMGSHVGDQELNEYVVRVKWLATVPREQAVWEKGFFANQHTACQLRRPDVIARLSELFGVEE